MQIEVYSDIICPWCYIGRARLSRALALRPAVRVKTRWRPFQLNPDMPDGGMDRGLYLSMKFGGMERAARVYGYIADAAAADGLPMALERITRTPNTRQAHRLILFAAEQGCEDAAIDRLFGAYFLDGLDLGDDAVLLGCARDIGLDAGAVADALARPDDGRVRASDGRARMMGVQGVPFHVFDGRYAVAGAQEPDAFLPLLDMETTVAAP